MDNTHSDYTRRLLRLLDICKNLSANLELEPLLSTILEAASELTRSELSTIQVPDVDTASMSFLAAPWHVRDKVKNLTFPLERSISGRVFTTGQAVMLENLAGYETMFLQHDLALNRKTYSILSVPLISRGETVGVLETTNKIGRAHYTEEDLFILETLAAQAAVAIQNHNLIEDSKQAYRKAIELDRMKNDFISIASHELRTPLGKIIGHAALLQDTAPASLQEDLDVIEKSACRLKEIIEAFSNIDTLEHGFTRLQAGQVWVSNMIHEVADPLIERARTKNIRMWVETPDDNVIIHGDPQKIGIALRNLVENAITFTNSGGAVKIKAEPVPGYVKISVIDSGIGIPAEELPNVFQRFYQVEKHMTRHHGGMGLGLSIARDMINMHGGKIWVESVEGKGSRFIFILPYTPEQASTYQRVFSRDLVKTTGGKV